MPTDTTTTADGDEGPLEDNEFLMVPGTYLSQAEVRAARAQAAERFGLDEEYVIVTPYGYPPQVKLPPGTPEGARRLPPRVKLGQAGWPAFWLDPVTRRRLPEETDDEYAVRLYLELVGRGFYDANTAEVRDALLAGKFNIYDDPADAERVLAYRDGEESDEALNGLVLPRGDLPSSSWARQKAAELVSMHRSHYQQILDAEVDLYQHRCRTAFVNLSAADPDTLISPVYGPGEDLLASDPADPNFNAARAAFSDAVEGIVEELNGYANDTFQLRVMLRGAGVNGYEDPRPQPERFAEADAAWLALKETVETAVAGVYVAGGTEESLGRVVSALREASAATAGAGRGLLADAEPVLPPEPPRGELPPASEPAGGS